MVESLEALEKQFQDSVKEVDASFKKREGIHELTVEQKAQALDVLRRLSKLHNEFQGATVEAEAIMVLPENLSASTLEFFNHVGTLLNECATEADQLRIRIENERETQDFVKLVQISRREDLATMINYLDKVSQQIGDLVGTFEAEMEKQAAHREKEAETLVILRNVLTEYQK